MFINFQSNLITSPCFYAFVLIFTVDVWCFSLDAAVVNSRWLWCHSLFTSKYSAWMESKKKTWIHLLFVPFAMLWHITLFKRLFFLFYPLHSIRWMLRVDFFFVFILKMTVYCLQRVRELFFEMWTKLFHSSINILYILIMSVAVFRQVFRIVILSFIAGMPYSIIGDLLRLASYICIIVYLYLIRTTFKWWDTPRKLERGEWNEWMNEWKKKKKPKLANGERMKRKKTEA